MRGASGSCVCRIAIFALFLACVRQGIAEPPVADSTASVSAATSLPYANLDTLDRKTFALEDPRTTWNGMFASSRRSETWEGSKSCSNFAPVASGSS
jgi:hypothetical protein